MRKLKRNRSEFETSGESLTHQSEHDRSEINRIVARGIVPPDPSQMTFGDFSGGEDFRDVQNRIIAVRNTFDSLPSETREKFANDPSKMLDFIANPENAEESVELGLLKPEFREAESVPKVSKKTVDSEPDPSKNDFGDASESKKPVT